MKWRLAATNPASHGKKSNAWMAYLPVAVAQAQQVQQVRLASRAMMVHKVVKAGRVLEAPARKAGRA
jgi:hypothetical protein